MTSTNAATGYAKYVGRVGALAVALGIGVAIANSPGIASADTGGSSTSSSSTGSNHSTTSAAPRHSHKQRSGRSSGARHSDHTTGPDGSGAGESSGAGTAADGRSTTRMPKVKPPRSNASAQENAAGADPNSTVRHPVSRAVHAAAEAATRTVGEPAAQPGVSPAPADAAVQSTPSTPAHAVSELVSNVVPLNGFKPNAINSPMTPAHDAERWAMLSSARRESQQSALAAGAILADATTPAVEPAAGSVVASQSADPTNPLATPEQLAAEQQANAIVDTPLVQLAKGVLAVTWYFSAQQNFANVGGPDQANLDQLNSAVDEYAHQAATEFQLLDSNDPKLLLQVNPPHTWYGQTAGGTRLWYDNPDTIYRFSGVNAASEYVITGHINPGTDPADTNISVLTGINGNTASNLSGKDIQVDANGDFTITLSSAPTAPGETNHLQLPPDALLVTTRNTLSDWNTQEPMTLSIERVSGPSPSLFGQIGGFAIAGIGPAVVQNPTLLSLVSSIPAVATPPLLVQSTVTALLMVVAGISGENKYIAVATTDPTTGQLRPPNELSQPAHNAEFLSTQLQSTGYFQLADDQALIVTVDPGSASYFNLPITNDWTITDNYWDQQTSLNNSQAVANPGGTYTMVISKNDPGVTNWVSTGGLNQGTISLRFQDVDPNSTDLPTVTSQVVELDEVKDYVPDNQDVYDRDQQIKDRQDGYNNRYTPYTQV